MAFVELERQERKASKHWRGRGDDVGIGKGSSLEAQVEDQKRRSLGSGSSDMHCRPCSGLSSEEGGAWCGSGCNREGAIAEDGQPCNWLVWKQKGNTLDGRLE